MNFDKCFKDYIRMKKINELLEIEDDERIRNIKKQMEQECEHILICMNIKEEVSGVIKIEEETIPNIIGMHYTVKCPICGVKQVLYFPIDIIPDFTTEIFDCSYDIFIALLENDIDKANDILKDALKENQKKENFKNAFDCFNTQLGNIGYFINHENKISKITTGGR